MSFYVPDSWMLPFFIALLLLFFFLPIAVLVTLGMWFQRRSGIEILRVLALITGGFAALCAVGVFIDYLESTFDLPSWSSSILIPIAFGILMKYRKRLGEFLITVGNALRGSVAE